MCYSLVRLLVKIPIMRSLCASEMLDMPRGCCFKSLVSKRKEERKKERREGRNREGKKTGGKEERK